MSEIEFYVQLISLESSLKKFAYRLTKKNEEAKDLFQDTCLRVLLNRNKFTSDENFKAWTFTIMKNTFINDYRTSFRQRTMQNTIKDTIIISRKNFLFQAVLIHRIMLRKYLRILNNCLINSRFLSQCIFRDISTKKLPIN